jgi:hypothetical protein
MGAKVDGSWLRSSLKLREPKTCSGQAKHDDVAVIGRQEHSAVPNDGSVELVMGKLPVPLLAVP